MTTTRYFEVKVTGCKDCPMKQMTNACNHPESWRLLPRQQSDLFTENRDQLTDSCPMWNETKESETK